MLGSTKVLVTGGVRSGKSTHAERLLADELAVAYVAPGPVPSADDADWTARVAAHRSRRPSSWTTHETRDLAPVLSAAAGAVLVDCVGTWLTAVVDAAALWEAPAEEVHGAVLAELDHVLAALGAAAGPVVLVTNEVGLGVVPAYRSGRLFRDLLGTVNQRLGAACDEVHLVVAGRVLRLPDPL
ncbi:bifunctional adenosylcobinamide kinase/adenosylcobinamide-phosphate guanylyltransferase [Nocardioides sp. Arc9.136]|uniref:bifunctional adenosylcobinamide kinase/adenosylcobinamide-phosphate guanylyltransferase n=1 Tax=Nocardioides sp. Arc9.136 TaxID=2996826 RepID=UPI0026665B36|nr:bifunctional adenosylcobinamide kinase/adenosylcobinamide-phosphate guanylyltransferase [Nocardioides sp. Arc9.136]WKN47046.1 bifunctional adenosylcobinamide kinase/adenosylcobinamide-phosphate guanylyltransferase [Nocardioides sp. Arc9.136]